MRKIRIDKTELFIQIWREVDERNFNLFIMFLNNVFFRQKGQGLCLSFQEKTMIFGYSLLGHCAISFDPINLNIKQANNLLNNFQHLQTSFDNRMRKKYQNANSQSNMRQLFQGFAQPYQNENENQNSKVEQYPYTTPLQVSSLNKQSKIPKSNDGVHFNIEKQQKKKKMGSEMDRMEDWMTDAYNKRRLQRQLKKNNNSNLDYSTVSVASTSSVKLPSINSPPAYISSNDQSKLVEQIRRVQNKIKELRFQRNLASTHQDKYEMMRPFVELQNQNMMNMQYMMMMAQQNKGHQHHCCSRSQNNQTRIVYLPYPQPTQVNPMQPQYYPPPPPPPYPMSYQQTPITTPQSYQTTAAKPSPKEDIKKKVYNFKKIRKFRVAVIAVYFSLLFPKYVNMFTKKRFQIHQEKYLLAKQPHYSVIITKAFDILSGINFYEISKTVQRDRKQKQVRRVTKNKTAKLVISQQYGQSKNYEIYLGDLELFLLILLTKLHEIIEEGTLDDLIKEVGVGNLPYSFPIDDNYLEQEMYRLKFHTQKAYLLCDQLQSKALLMITFFIKLFAYDFLFVIRQDEQWKEKLLKKNNLKRNQMIEAEMVTTQMYISGILLHRYCMDILQDEIKQIEGNVDKLDQKMIAVPMGMMSYEDKDEVKKNKFGRNSIEKRGSQQRSSKTETDQDQQYHLYQFQYIKNLKEFQNLMEEIIQKSGHNDEVKEKISDIIDQIFKKTTQSRSMEYKEIKDAIICENKHIISKKLGAERNFFEMPKRTSEQKKEISELVNAIKSDKKKENPRYEADGANKLSKKLTMKSIKVVSNKNKQI